MILLTIDEIIMLHGKLLETTGGLLGLRDRGLLESAVFSMNTSFEDVEQYPTVYTVRNHETGMMIFGSLLSALPAVTAGSLVMP